ncbi:entericidin A/B family lipoprotein [Tepidimonas taiwanensis]|uniref:Entericidin EcnA/B family protein n=1 Tax=Tepidimonas taiwanensis TaxID=307486 RepID=A0A554XED8_9BURK|nr:entericidin A/B family lipoprotein [Tepidimonas taiwanensis]MCX7692083.1 entericidin A/B family lipoprotein [Tepidimonas taiwanensis]MDM7464268.1 entericidin A/B family lipoprotein [Tepidimonas taiwanensis]TSE34202.1 Entericidin EcnA/B family protein [Tepidimonas taiwanensis]UBQ04829.1 entericidin A/B family lipoprotein [Tepidimonas taiwanensis]
MMRSIGAILVGLGLLLTGCNTVAGLGKDIQKGGQVLQDAAKK